MQAAAHRLEFAPPPQPGLGRALVLALLAHLLLVAALGWGVSWKHDATPLAAEAELWAALPQQAAPPLEQAPPPPPPPPAVVAPAPPAPLPREADIALAREKKKREQQEKAKQEAEKAETKKRQLAQEKREQELAKREQLEKVAKAKARDASDAKRAETQREENLRRMQGLAGATGAATATGAASRSAGPSASYAGRIMEQIKSNTTFTDATAGRPSVVVLVRATPSGQILSRKVVTSSGNKAWDEAVLRAVDKMGAVPKDVDGRIPEELLREGLELKVTL